MKKKSQLIDPKQMRLLFVLLIVVILVSCYRFGYLPIQEKTERLKEENQNLQVRDEELSALVRREQEFDEQIPKSKKNQHQILSQYGVGNTPEKSIEFLMRMEQVADMQISSISFAESKTVFRSDSFPTKANTGLYLLYSPVSINYICSYNGLKRCIDYIHDNKEYMDIASVTAAFDGETGMLSGTLVIDQYAVLGTNRLYEPPNISSIPIGKSNIFGEDD